MRHVYWGVAGYLVFAFVLLFLIARVYRAIMRKKFPHMRLYDVRGIPVLLFITMLFLTVLEPISLYVSREMEKQADAYAIEHTEDLEPAIEGSIRLAVQSKSDIDPVFWVKWMRYSHPPMQERIDSIKNTIEERESK